MPIWEILRFSQNDRGFAQNDRGFAQNDRGYTQNDRGFAQNDSVPDSAVALTSLSTCVPSGRQIVIECVSISIGSAAEMEK